MFFAILNKVPYYIKFPFVTRAVTPVVAGSSYW